MGRRPSGNARTAPMHLRVTPQFKRYVAGVLEEEGGISESSLIRNSLGLFLALRRDYREAAAAADMPLDVFVKVAVKDYVARTTP